MYKKMTQRVPFTHTTISSFYKALVDYFMNYCYDFNTVVLGTFQKCIQHIYQKKEYPNDEIMKYGGYAPILTLTPTLMDPVPQTDMLWKYSNMFPYQISWFQDDVVFQDGHSFNIITRRYAGNIEYRVFADSQMELHDITIALHDAFRGLNKWYPLMCMKTFLVLHDKIRLFTEQGVLLLDWSKTNMSDKFFPSVNQDRYYYPLEVNPILMLQSLSDNSSFYGGSGLPEYSIGGTIAFEIEIPSLYTLMTHVQIINMDISTTVTPLVPSPDLPVNFVNHDGYIETNVEEKLTIGEDDDGNDQIVKIIDEYGLDFCTERGVPLTFPVVLNNIGFNLASSSFIVLIDGKKIPKTDYEILDEHTLRVLKGPEINEGCVNIKTCLIKPMVCHKQGVCFI